MSSFLLPLKGSSTPDSCLSCLAYWAMQSFQLCGWLFQNVILPHSLSLSHTHTHTHTHTRVYLNSKMDHSYSSTVIVSVLTPWLILEQTPEGRDTSSFITSVFVVLTAALTCRYGRCVKEYMCYRDIYIWTHSFSLASLFWQRLRFFFFFFFFLSRRAKGREGVLFHALCNLFLWAKIKLSQSGLIYYRSCCLFLSCLARKWTLTSPAQQLNTALRCHISNRGHPSSHFAAVLFFHFGKKPESFALTPLHVLVQPNSCINPGE